MVDRICGCFFAVLLFLSLFVSPTCTLSLLFLPIPHQTDEPSTGMDPVSRRFMWEFLTETMANRAVILTTHSMEECEALCARIGILVLGELKCLGAEFGRMEGR